MDLKSHWEHTFETRSPAETSWYTPHLQHSIRWIEESGLPRTAAILDVGAGRSTLIDDLLARGYTDLTALDISESALAEVRQRLSHRADSVTWIAGDVTTVPLPPGRYDLWHDRALFHFLTEPAQRHQYLNQIKRALKPGGLVILSTFGPEGPVQCSGLAVCRYDRESLAAVFGHGFTLQYAEMETHTTPSGKPQQFLHARFISCG
ncbi:MAG TPA: class I SAM-dependent methyltransferase [Acidobacteriaceae bacterium]|nr:class I SAM-dependent methyltransferase [Acidobacteriaceae bacterium]